MKAFCKDPPGNALSKVTVCSVSISSALLSKAIVVLVDCVHVFVFSDKCSDMVLGQVHLCQIGLVALVQ